ncbi:MAG: WD40/YVTN/BNR-like repeat-containing protein [Polyangia bacterium]
MRVNGRWSTRFAALALAVVASSSAPAQSPAPGALPCAAPVACAGTMSGGWCIDTFLAGDRTFPQFSGVWSDAPNDVWAVGAHTGARGAGRGFAFHWDGCAWSPASLPGGPQSTVGLGDVWGTRGDDLWIVGAQGSAFHWNGKAWSAVNTGAAGALEHVSGSSGADVWAFGTGGLFHWNGRAWSADARLPPKQSSEPVGDIWAVAPDDVWVAQGLNARGSLAHYDGARWTVVRPSPDLAFGLFGIWSNGATTWAVGEGNQVVRSTNGRTWAQLAPPGGSSRGWVNVMGSASELWAAGQTVGRSTSGGALRSVAGVPPGFYPGLWLNESQVWIAGITNAGAAVVAHRAR